MNPTIELSIRSHDEWRDSHGQRWAKWHACVRGDLARWECGQNAEDAVNALIRSHPSAFPGGRSNTKVDYLGVMNR